MATSDMKADARQASGDASEAVTACVLCRGETAPHRARDVSSFLCGACEGMLVTHNREVMRVSSRLDDAARAMGIVD